MNNVLDQLQDPDKCVAFMVSLAYNWKKWPWQWISPLQVQTVLAGLPVKQSIDYHQVVMIAKLFCKGAGVACPYIEKLPD